MNRRNFPAALRPLLSLSLSLCLSLWLWTPRAAVGADTSSSARTAAADWTLTFDPSAAPNAGSLDPALLGQYELSGSLFHFDQVSSLPPLMKAAGFAEWRVGLGRWEFGTQLLPALTDGTSCASRFGGLSPAALAPPNTTDLDLIRARDWFTYTDGAPVTTAMTRDDGRYQLAYIRSVLDVVSAFGAAPFVNIDHMPRALAANATPVRSTADWIDPCGITWTNRVSNARPADPGVFAAAAAGLVQRVVEGSGGEPGRPVRYWEFWNEPELAYAWAPAIGDFGSHVETAAATLFALDAYRRESTDRNGRAIRIGLGSFAEASTAVAVLPILDAAGVPFDFVSFHAESDDDPLAVLSKIQFVVAAVKASRHPDAEVLLTEWSNALSGSTLDPKSMDVALFDATVIALGATAGVTHMHHAIFWDYFGPGSPGLGFLDHDGTPRPAYYAYTMLASVIGAGSSRLAPAESPSSDGRLDGGMGAFLASRDAGGTIRALLINRGAVARTVSIGAVPTSVTVFDDPARPPHSVVVAASAAGPVVTVPPRSLVLIERADRSGTPSRGPVIPPSRHRRRASNAQIVFEAPGVPGGGSVQELFTMNLDGSNRTQITHDGLNKFLPHFSPDGARLVYTKFLSGQYGDAAARTDVVVYDFVTGRETQLTHTGTGYQPAWSPDGSRIAFGSIHGDSLWIMDADGSNPRLVGEPSFGPDDFRWYDFAWSRDDWILFVVAQDTNGCFKARIDKIRPDGTARTQVTDGGPNCTQPGREQSGDSDPGFSADGKTIYSSRGFPGTPAGVPAYVVRRLYSISSGAWTPGKVENDLSLPSAPDCVEGVPKGSPDGKQVLLFRACESEPHMGVTLTDTAGTYRLWIVDGFGADWNPVAN